MRGLFFEGLIFGGVYLRREIDWANLIVGSKFIVFSLFALYLRAIFQVQALEGLYLKRRFNGRFFALPVWGAHIWRSLYMDGLIFEILRFTLYTDLAEMYRGMRYGEGDKCIKWHEAYFNFNSNYYKDEYL